MVVTAYTGENVRRVQKSEEGPKKGGLLKDKKWWTKQLFNIKSL